MNGVHDMGGMHGMGAVETEPGEPVFHHDWERRAFALTVASGYLGRWNIDMSRYTRELMPPAEYLATSYYEHWLWGLERLLGQAGLVEAAELAARLRGETIASPPLAHVRPLRAAELPQALRAGGARVESDLAARFAPGDRVRARTMNPLGHTRLPRYARGKTGVIDRAHGVWVFPDTNAAGQGKNPQHLYSVRFTARELWGEEASPRDTVYLDLFEDYLEPQA